MASSVYLRISLLFFFLLAPARETWGSSVVSGEIRWKKERLALSVGDAVLKIPQGHAPGRRFPALLVFGGFEEAGKVLDLVHPKRPVILASFDYPYKPPRKFHFPESLRFAPEVKASIHDTLAGIRELREALLRRTDVDPAKISILGASFGAPFATISAVTRASALEPGFAGLVLVHGFGDMPGTAMHQLLRSWRSRFGAMAYPMAWLLSNLSWFYLDAEAPEEAAERLAASQHVLVITAENDSFIPQKSSEILWKGIQASGAQAEREIMPGDHLQPGSDALIAKILERVTGWMEGRKLL